MRTPSHPSALGRSSLLLAALAVGAWGCTGTGADGDEAADADMGGETAGAAQMAAAGDMEAMKMYLVNGFERAKAWDVSLAEAMPDSAMGFAPTPGVRSFADQIVHASSVGFIAPAIFGMEAPDTGVAEGSVPDKATLVTAVQSGYDWMIAQLNAMDAAALAEEVEFMGGQMMPRWRIGTFALEHAMWTRGQLVPYLHLNGVEVPQQQLF